MQISVELTLSPLQDDFETPVIKFIKTLRRSGFQVVENPLSTHVYGDYDRIMSFLTDEVKEIFTGSDHILLQMKIVKGNLSRYAADF